MTEFSIASFNVKNLIGPDREFYRFQSYTPEEYAWKKAWLAEQLLALDADVVGFQEIFEEEPLREVVSEADARGAALNADALPDAGKAYRKRAIFRRLEYTPYAGGALAFAPNAADAGQPGERRPGLALVSRLGLQGRPEIIQDLDEPLQLDFPQLRGAEGLSGGYRLTRLSRPILKARLPLGPSGVTLFNCHLKSKLGEYVVPPGADYPPEADLTRYDALGRAAGSLRAGLRRMAEALVLRREILAELATGRAVIALGDFNDGEHAVAAEIIGGEVPFKNYSWMLRHDARHRDDRYSAEEDKAIRGAVEAVRLHSAEKLFVRKSLRDMVYTSAFAGVYESIEQIYLSRHFHPDNPDRIGEMTYFRVFNDHLTDGSHPEAPYNKLASDHGQIVATIRMRD